ncbi:class I SAM-dependent methyltransferase [Acidaminobacter sp. JC074]|uniref:class I SAM-dependent methyltransferase n=1 Tax=Acidaminobacter sp. JC074 TaxID=2530199 RepID=UPI001F0D583E|nr:class I SAM-dependent methyltransferase [Acidaminobacter sp. JC074]MCH4887115.1 class I SAM-dependent methyltransferase [Acidaminobacter sp. JC074]
MFKRLLTYLPRSPRILDLCCGVGSDSDRLNQLGASVVGLDFSEESIKIARKNYPKNDFNVGNMLEDYSHLGRFDGCILLAGLVHIPNNRLEMAFKQLYKVLKKDAYVLIIVNDGIGKSERMSLQTVDGEDFDREFYDHTLDELLTASKKQFEFVYEHVENSESLWKNYIFKAI